MLSINRWVKRICKIVKIADIYTKYLKVPTRIMAQKIKRAELIKALILILPNVGIFLTDSLCLFRNEKLTTSISIDFFIILMLLNVMG